jgi:hypothetical protein
MQAGVIIARARQTLIAVDDNEFWEDPELLDYLSAAQTAVGKQKPDALARAIDHALAAGPMQTLPVGFTQVLDVVYNKVSGKTAMQKSRRVFDHSFQTLFSQAAAVDVLLWRFDERLPDRYWVLPPNSGAGAVQVIAAKRPARLVALTDELELGDEWETALWAYVVAHAFAKNSMRQDLTKFSSFMAVFSAYLAGASQAQVADAPKQDAR